VRAPSRDGGTSVATESAGFCHQEEGGKEEVEHSPRRPPPEIPEWKTPILAKARETQPPRKSDSALGPDPWLPGGCGILSGKKTDQSRGLHFDSLWRAEAVRLSPDRASATFRGQSFGGLVASSEVLERRACGRWYEVLVEEANPRWSDGLGIGVATVDSRDAALARVKNAERVIEGFAYELIPESWLVGYDGRAKLRGMSRYLQAHEIHQGMWRPNQLTSGDIVGLLATTDGNLMLFVNEELRYFVTCADIPWKKQICAVVDLDGCTQSIHLLDSNGTPPDKVVQSWQAAVAALKAPA